MITKPDIMKRNLAFILLLFAIFRLDAQYQSIFGTTQTSWNVFDGTRSYYTDSFYVVKDTIVDSQAYKLINQAPATAMSPGGPAFFLKEDSNSGKVWYRSLTQDSNILIMDLNLQLGDSFDFNIWPYPKVDSVYIKNGKKHVRFGPKQFSSTTIYKHLEFIEGTGPNYGITPNSEALLLCMRKDNTRTYEYPVPLPGWFRRINDCAYYMIRESTEELGNNFRAATYPNPIQDKLFINISNYSNSAITLKLINITGQVVYLTSFTGNNFEVNIQNLPAGIYLCQLAHNNEVAYNGKLVKE